MLSFYTDAGIDGDDAVLVGEEGIDVDLLDLSGEAEKRGEAYDDLSVSLFVEAFLTAGALDDLIAAQRTDHRVGLVVGEGSETGGDVLQHLDEDASQSAEDDMAEAFLVFRADKEFGAFEHLLHHHASGIGDLHHTVELKGEMLGSADVQRHTTHIALVNRTDDLRHDGITHLLGKGDELVLRRGYLLGHHRDAGTREQFAHGLWRYIAIGVDAGDGLVETGDVDAVELYLEGCWLGGVHDL